ncbi:hypothetical protein BDR03DRAFT_822552, partial [Suillus americanus]
FNRNFNFPSIYRGPPSPEIDAAWARIAGDVRRPNFPDILSSNLRPTRMSLEENLKAGKLNMVSMEAPHQLHCLVSYTTPKYYGHAYIVFHNKPETVRMHLHHCIEMIRLNIICDADVTMITWDWVQGRDIPYPPNFNTRHQCRNYEKILDW